MLATAILTPLHDAPLFIRVLFVLHQEGAPVKEWTGHWRTVEQNLTLFAEHDLDIHAAKEVLERGQTVTLQLVDDGRFESYRKLLQLSVRLIDGEPDHKVYVL